METSFTLLGRCQASWLWLMCGCAANHGSTLSVSCVTFTSFFQPTRFQVKIYPNLYRASKTLKPIYPKDIVTPNQVRLLPPPDPTPTPPNRSPPTTHNAHPNKFPRKNNTTGHEEVWTSRSNPKSPCYSPSLDHHMTAIAPNPVNSKTPPATPSSY